MATKSSKSKSAGSQKIQAGGAGKMHKFSGLALQKPGVTAVTQSAGKGASFPMGGPSGKMRSFTKVKAQKSGRSSQS